MGAYTSLTITLGSHAKVSVVAGKTKGLFIELFRSPSTYVAFHFAINDVQNKQTRVRYNSNAAQCPSADVTLLY